MAIANIHESLLMYTKQKSKLNLKLSTVMMNILTATRKNAELQQEYAERVSEAYFDPSWGGEMGDTPEYQMVLRQYESEHQFELAQLDAWESELELQKNNLETRINEITTYESNCQKMLQSNIKNDFSYGNGGK